MKKYDYFIFYVHGCNSPAIIGYAENYRRCVEMTNNYIKENKINTMYDMAFSFNQKTQECDTINIYDQQEAIL